MRTLDSEVNGEASVLYREGMLCEGRLHFPVVWLWTARSSSKEGHPGTKNKPSTKAPGEEIYREHAWFWICKNISYVSRVGKGWGVWGEELEVCFPSASGKMYLQ